MSRDLRDMKIVAIIQARMGSGRLPGKVMRELGGKPVLAHVIERVKASGLVDEVIVATTTSGADDVIVSEGLHRGARVFRGSEPDVLQRYADAAREAAADVVVRVTSDCPLLDPVVLGQMLRRYRQARDAGQKLDYLSNTIERTFPRGLDVEIVARSALEQAHREAQERYQREHVTPYIWQHPELFAIEQYRAPVDRSAHRWTLDTEADWAFLTAVFGLLRESGSEPTTAAVLELLESHPELRKINAHVEQKTAMR